MASSCDNTGLQPFPQGFNPQLSLAEQRCIKPGASYPRGFPYSLAETPEKMPVFIRAWGIRRAVLHSHDGFGFMGKAFQRAVVQVDVAGRKFGGCGNIHGKAVVLR